MLVCSQTRFHLHSVFLKTLAFASVTSRLHLFSLFPSCAAPSASELSAVQRGNRLTVGGLSEHVLLWWFGSLCDLHTIH